MDLDRGIHQPPRSLLDAARTLLTRRMLTSFAMGFACGLPLLLTIGVLQAWMRDVGIDLSVIGLMALTQLPYSLKFLWAPLFDRFTLPFLGRRRGWLLVSQLALIGAIALLALTRPEINPWTVAWAALLVTFTSATQDILVDAYRREDLAEEELGLGSSLYVGGYRLGTLFASGGGLFLADHMPFRSVYLIMAAAMSIGVLATLFSPEPDKPLGTPHSFRESVIEPFAEFLRRRDAWLILAFILFYKLGDTMASVMSIPFFLDLGFSKTEVAAIYKVFGFSMTMTGLFVGGLVILRIGISRSLWVFGFLQMISTAGFAVLARLGDSLSGLTAVIAFENLSAGMGMAAFVAFMAHLTNKRFTATQYALLTALSSVPRTAASAPTGYLVEWTSWSTFFIFCTLIAIPGLLMLAKFAPWTREIPADELTAPGELPGSQEDEKSQ